MVYCSPEISKLDLALHHNQEKSKKAKAAGKIKLYCGVHSVMLNIAVVEKFTIGYVRCALLRVLKALKEEINLDVATHE
jgi:hypothetical protein